jgi:hypothetical protein
VPVVYCAPARRPFNRLHIAEDGADFHAPEGCEGLTVCGLLMARDELWLPLARAGEPVCRDCAGGDAALAERQLVLVESV